MTACPNHPKLDQTKYFQTLLPVPFLQQTRLCQYWYNISTFIAMTALIEH